jgi:transcriptional regulator with XRE-family HTH domain
MRDAQRAAIVVRAGRTARGLSRKELAATAAEEDQLPYSTIANFENGQRRLTAEMSVRLAQALGITDDQFFDGLAAATHSLRLWEAGEAEWCFPVRSWVAAVFEVGPDRVRLVEASITELLKPESLVVAPDTPASRKLGEMLESFREAAGMTIDQLSVSQSSIFDVDDFAAAESGNFGSDPTALTAEFLTAVGVPVAMASQTAAGDSGVDMHFLDPERNVRVALEFKTRAQREGSRPPLAPTAPPVQTPDPRTREELIGMIVARLVQAPMEVIAQVADHVGIEVGPWLRQ